MNANELADKLNEWYNYSHENMCNEAATMLRQQQAEIEALKQTIDANKLSQNIGQFVKPANEPVAYGRYIKNAKMWLVVELDADIPEGYIPLYTHPASKAKDRFSNYESICLQCGITVYKPFKELTDEEILKMASDKFHYSEYRLVIDFARAILKKASEK
jgi:hypothetical protein